MVSRLRPQAARPRWSLVAKPTMAAVRRLHFRPPTLVPLARCRRPRSNPGGPQAVFRSLALVFCTFSWSASIEENRSPRTVRRHESPRRIDQPNWLEIGISRVMRNMPADRRDTPVCPHLCRVTVEKKLLGWKTPFQHSAHSSCLSRQLGRKGELTVAGLNCAARYGGRWRVLHHQRIEAEHHRECPDQAGKDAALLGSEGRRRPRYHL